MHKHGWHGGADKIQGPATAAYPSRTDSGRPSSCILHLHPNPHPQPHPHPHPPPHSSGERAKNFAAEFNPIINGILLTSGIKLNVVISGVQWNYQWPSVGGAGQQDYQGHPGYGCVRVSYMRWNLMLNGKKRGKKRAGAGGGGKEWAWPGPPGPVRVCRGSVWPDIKLVCI